MSFQAGNLVRLKRLPGNVNTQKFHPERFQIIGIITECVDEKYFPTTYKVKWLNTESLDNTRADLLDVDIWYPELLEKVKD